MHVALICPYSMSEPGGVQEHVRGLAAALLGSGHDVSVFAPELRRRSEHLDAAVLVSLGGAVGIPANGSIAPLGIDPRMLVRFELGLDAADVVHIHEAFLPAGLAAAFRAPRRTPVVATFHAAAESFWPYALAAPLLRRVARRFDATTAVSPAARRLVRRYVPVDPVLIPNGVDVAAFKRAVPDAWAAGLGRVVLFVGRPERRKGFDLMLRAFAGAAAHLDDVHLVCVPAGPTDGEVLAAGVRERVHRLGPVERERLLGLYRAADIVCVPSVGGESFGLVVLEGLAAGAAVLASDLPGYRYAGGDAAEYVPPGEGPAWRRALQGLLSDEERRARLAEGGPGRAREFDWAAVAERTVETYRAART